MPFFSVVIPLYNKEKYIEDTLSSVLNQSFQDFEIIIVDDGSTDDSYKVASRFQSEKIKLLKQDNQGVSIARNKGIDYATSNYIALLDADDLWYNNHLQELKKLIEKFPNAGLFCNNYEVKRCKEFIIPTTFNFNFSTDSIIIKDFFEASIITFIPTSSSVAFLKSTFNDIGGYNTKLRSGQDTDLWIKLGLKYKVAFNPKITTIYNNFDDNSLSKSKYNTDRYELINNYNKNEKSNPSLKKYLDINRYALAIRCRLNDEILLYKKLKREIDYNNLNWKQKILLNCPNIFLRFTKELQQFLVKNQIYLTAYK